MESKVCVVTGGNSGLGFETVVALVRKRAKVYLWCRSEEKGCQARERIVDAFPEARIEVIFADLGKRAAIRKGVRKILFENRRLDVLVNNAAAVFSKPVYNEDGLEMQFAVNYLGHFYLTHLLLPLLAEEPGGRIVNVSSRNHFLAGIHFDNLNLDGEYHLLRAYSQSKLANVLFTYELDRRCKQWGLDHITVNCADPGLNNTRIATKQTSFLHGLIWQLRRRMGRHPSQGAATQIYLASSREVAGVSGLYWANMRPVRSAPRSYCREDAMRLWEISLKLCGIRHFYQPAGIINY